MNTLILGRSVDDCGDRVRPQIEEARKRIERLDGQARGFITEHPAACLLSGLALGYLVARVARRQSWRATRTR